MDNAGKLVINSKDGVVYISGVLSEGSNFLSVAEAFGSNVTGIDFRNLTSATWNGLIKLHEISEPASQKLGQPLQVFHMSYGIYRFFRMLKNFENCYRMESVELPLVEAAPEGPRFVNAFYTQAEFAAILESLTYSGFLMPSENTQIMGRKDFHPALLSGMAAMPRDYTHVYDLIHDYALYSEAIFALSEDLCNGLVLSIKRIFRELSSTLSTTKAAIGEVSPDKMPNFDELQAQSLGFEDKIAQRAQEIKDYVTTIRAELYSIAGEAQKALIEGDSANDSAIRMLDGVCSATLRSEEAAKTSEELGVAAGDLFGFFVVLNEGRTFSKNLPSSGVDADKIAKLIDIYSIMDPMADEMDFLVENIDAYYSAAENELNLLSTVSQSCDLMRQIMEHRITEVKIIKSYISNFGLDTLEASNLAMLKDELIAQISRKLVTDQEKFAFDFFVSNTKAKESEASASPGDIMLF